MPYFIKCFKNCDTFGDLRFILYASHGHILRSHYVAFNCSNLISAPDTNLNPVGFGGNSILIQYWYPINVSLHYQRCILFLVAARKKTLEDVSAASFVLHAQNFASAMEENVVPKFTNRLS